MRFRKGEPRPANAGRKVGSLNKRTVFVKGMLEDAAAEIGGLERLVRWIKADPQNEYAFWTSMFMRLLPVQILGSGQDGALVIEVRREELAKKLQERGLPPIVFGVDAPTIDGQVQDIVTDGRGGNGRDGNGDAR